MDLDYKKPKLKSSITETDTNKIHWGISTEWYTLTNDIGYPRLQGKIPMFNSLTDKTKSYMLKQYLNVKTD